MQNTNRHMNGTDKQSIPYNLALLNLRGTELIRLVVFANMALVVRHAQGLRLILRLNATKGVGTQQMECACWNLRVRLTILMLRKSTHDVVNELYNVFSAPHILQVLALSWHAACIYKALCFPGRTQAGGGSPLSTRLIL